LKKPITKRAGGVAQGIGPFKKKKEEEEEDTDGRLSSSSVEHLPSKSEVLSLNPSIAPRSQKRKDVYAF
jgi:hypothetical protein